MKKKKKMKNKCIKEYFLTLCRRTKWSNDASKEVNLFQNMNKNSHENSKSNIIMFMSKHSDLFPKQNEHKIITLTKKLGKKECIEHKWPQSACIVVRVIKIYMNSFFFILKFTSKQSNIEKNVSSVRKQQLLTLKVSRMPMNDTERKNETKKPDDTMMYSPWHHRCRQMSNTEMKFE